MPDAKRDQTKQASPAEKARGGEIILRKRGQRVVFIAGLAGAVLLGFFFAVWGR